MWNKLRITALGAGLLLASQVAQADERDARRWEEARGPGYSGEAARGGDYDYARVLNSEPITRRIRVTEPRRECYEETRYDDRDRYDSRYDGPRRGGRGRATSGSDSAGSTLLGGIIGAAIGNQIGRGDGRRAATAAGAIIGAAIGNDAARRGPRDSRYADDVRYRDDVPTTVQHCDVRYDERWEERVEAYLVTYEYNGRRYTTRMNYDPGPRLRVNVSVRPDGR